MSQGSGLVFPHAVHRALSGPDGTTGREAGVFLAPQCGQRSDDSSASTAARHSVTRRRPGAGPAPPPPRRHGSPAPSLS